MLVMTRGRPRKDAMDTTDRLKEAASEWFAAFLIVRAMQPNADVWVQIAATDYALRTK